MRFKNAFREFTLGPSLLPLLPFATVHFPSFPPLTFPLPSLIFPSP